MPLYDYDCAACDRRFEVIHGVNDAPPEVCPLCGKGPVRKAFAPPAILFKGSGWAKKERRAAVKSSTSSDDGDKGPDTDATSKPSDPGSQKGSDKTPGKASSPSGTPGPTPSSAPASPGSDD